MSSGKPKAKVKDMNLPDAPEPSRCRNENIKGGVRSISSIKIAEYLAKKEKERYERKERKKHFE